MPASGTSLRRQRRRQSLPVIVVLAALVLGAVLPFAWARLNDRLADAPARPAGDVVRFQRCASSSAATCVVDGDTFRLRGDIIRIADIDTPETHGARCDAEAALGNRATDRMMALLNAGPFDLVPWPERDRDRYGRLLRVVRRDGRSLGQQLVTEGLARTWTGHRRPWCDAL